MVEPPCLRIVCNLPSVVYALDLFLALHMLESKDYMHQGDPKKLVTSPHLFLYGSGTHTYPYSERPEDKSMDAHVQTGFYLGNGVMHMILSLMPGKLHTVMGLLGYKGNWQVALMFCHCLGVRWKMGRASCLHLCI